MNSNTIIWICMWVFILCDVGIYSILTHRVRTLEKRYLSEWENNLDLTKGMLDSVEECLNNCRKITSVLEGKIEETGTEIEKAGKMKETERTKRDSLVSYILSHFGSVINIFDKEALLLYGVQDEGAECWEWLKSFGLYICWLSRGDAQCIVSSPIAEGIVGAIVSLEPILEDGWIVKTLTDGDEILYSDDMVEMNAYIDDILERVRETRSDEAAENLASELLGAKFEIIDIFGKEALLARVFGGLWPDYFSSRSYFVYYLEHLSGSPDKPGYLLAYPPEKNLMGMVISMEPLMDISNQYKVCDPLCLISSDYRLSGKETTFSDWRAALNED